MREALVFQEDLGWDVTGYRHMVDAFQDEGKTVIFLGTREKIEGSLPQQIRSGKKAFLRCRS